jgi:aldehyde dehydrogenase (NAD+)
MAIIESVRLRNSSVPWEGIVVRGGGAPSMDGRSGYLLQHLVGGQVRPGSEHVSKVDAPDNVPFVDVPIGNETDVRDAVAVAVGSDWPQVSPEQRATVLVRAADLLETQRDSLAEMIVYEVGKPVAQACGEVARAAQTLRQFAFALDGVRSRVVPQQSPRVWGMELPESLGPAAILATWNMPIQLTAVKAGAALAAGCPVVLKPSPIAPTAAHALVWALRAAGLPATALSVVHGDAATGGMLVRHPDIRVVSFTGRSSSGAQVMAAAAATLKKVVLELGGKSANIVFADADLDRAVAGIVAGIARNQGATCTAGSRIVVHCSIVDVVVDRLRAALQRVRVGDPFDPRTDVGAIVDGGLARHLLDRAAVLRQRGYQLVPAGPLRLHPPQRTGWYLRPCVAVGVTPADPLCDDEFFGPIGLLMSFSDEDEAVEIANRNPYGLAPTCGRVTPVGSSACGAAWRSAPSTSTRTTAPMVFRWWPEGESCRASATRAGCVASRSSWQRRASTSRGTSLNDGPSPHRVAGLPAGHARRAVAEVVQEDVQRLQNR